MPDTEPDLSHTLAVSASYDGRLHVYCRTCTYGHPITEAELTAADLIALQSAHADAVVH